MESVESSGASVAQVPDLVLPACASRGTVLTVICAAYGRTVDFQRKEKHARIESSLRNKVGKNWV